MRSQLLVLALCLAVTAATGSGWRKCVSRNSKPIFSRNSCVSSFAITPVTTLFTGAAAVAAPLQVAPLTTPCGYVSVDGTNGIIVRRSGAALISAVIQLYNSNTVGDPAFDGTVTAIVFINGLPHAPFGVAQVTVPSTPAGGRAILSLSSVLNLLRNDVLQVRLAGDSVGSTLSFGDAYSTVTVQLL